MRVRPIPPPFWTLGSQTRCPAAFRPSGIPAIETFAAGVRQDEAAVKAALTMPWSRGQAEGQVNKLKLIKRQMYGRANFDVLRRRVLLAA